MLTCWQENGAAFDAGGLEVGQLILEVDGHKVEGKLQNWSLLLQMYVCVCGGGLSVCLSICLYVCLSTFDQLCYLFS